MDKIFTKNDDEFICQNCGKKVDKLKYSSRDHCNKCLCSLHVDINPGDRANDCCGLLVPYSCEMSSKKGYVIRYRCSKCGQFHNNKSAEDDSKETIFKIMNGTYNKDKY